MGTLMTENQVRGLGPALDRFLQPFLFCCAYTQTFDHLRTYCRGLLSDFPLKIAEPHAITTGTPVHTLQEFLRDPSWDFFQAADQAQKHAAGLLPKLPND